MGAPEESGETLLAARFADVAASLGGELRSVIAEFHEFALRGATQIERANAQADHEAVRTAAHRLRGSSMTLGVERLSHLSAEIERAASLGGEITPHLLAALAAEIAAAYGALLAAAPAERSSG